MKNKKYGGKIGTVIDIDYTVSDGDWITVEFEGEEDVDIMRRPSTITHKGQKVHMSVIPIGE